MRGDAVANTREEERGEHVHIAVLLIAKGRREVTLVKVIQCVRVTLNLKGNIQMADTTKVGFTAQMKRFFGFRDGQNVNDFASELRALSYEEKKQFCQWLNDAGFPTEEPAVPAKPA